jgi:hypothetical protein
MGRDLRTLADALFVRNRIPLARRGFRMARERALISLPHALLLVLALCAALEPRAIGAADFADVAKTLRASMDGEEAGFDPQAVGEAYSFTVIGAIFWNCPSSWRRKWSMHQVACNRVTRAKASTFSASPISMWAICISTWRMT